MALGPPVLLALRLLGPLTIFRWPLAGGIAAMLLDMVDVIIVDALGTNALWDNSYTEIDKGLDTYYLAIEALVAWRWTNAWARWPALLLFVDRFVGAVAYELTEVRALLFLFPNLFENWWLYCVIVSRFWPRLAPRSAASVAIPLLFLLVPKMVQEYYLHILQVHPWMWLRSQRFGG